MYNNGALRAPEKRDSLDISSRLVQILVITPFLILGIGAFVFICTSPVLVPALTMRWAAKGAASVVTGGYYSVNRWVVDSANVGVQHFEKFREYSRNATIFWNPGVKMLKNIYLELAVHNITHETIAEHIQGIESVRPKVIALYARMSKQVGTWGGELVDVAEKIVDAVEKLGKEDTVRILGAAGDVVKILQPRMADLATLAKTGATLLDGVYDHVMPPIKRMLTSVAGSTSSVLKMHAHLARTDPHKYGLVTSQGVFKAFADAALAEIPRGIGQFLAQLDTMVDSVLVGSAQIMRSVSDNVGAIVRFFVGLFERRTVIFFDLVSTISDTAPQIVPAFVSAVKRMLTTGDFEKKILASVRGAYSKMPDIGATMWASLKKMLDFPEFPDFVRKTMMHPFASGSLEDFFKKMGAVLETDADSLDTFMGGIFGSLAHAISVAMTSIANPKNRVSLRNNYESMRRFALALEGVKDHSPHRLPAQLSSSGNGFSRMLITLFKKISLARTELFDNIESSVVASGKHIEEIVARIIEFMSNMFPTMANAITSLSGSSAEMRYSGRASADAPLVPGSETRLQALLSRFMDSLKTLGPKIFAQFEGALRNNNTRSSFFQGIVGLFDNSAGSLGTMTSLFTEFITKYPKSVARIVFGSLKQSITATPIIAQAVQKLTDEFKAFNNSQFKKDFSGIFDEHTSVQGFFIQLGDAWLDGLTAMIPAGWNVAKMVIRLVMDSLLKTAGVKFPFFARGVIMIVGAPTDERDTHSSGSIPRFFAMIFELVADMIAFGIELAGDVIKIVDGYMEEVTRAVKAAGKIIAMFIVGLFTIFADFVKNNNASEMIADFFTQIINAVIDAFKALLVLIQKNAITVEKLLEMIDKTLNSLLQIIIHIRWDQFIPKILKLVACVILKVLEQIPGLGAIIAGVEPSSLGCNGNT